MPFYCEHERNFNTTEKSAQNLFSPCRILKKWLKKWLNVSNQFFFHRVLNHPLWGLWVPVLQKNGHAFCWTGFSSRLREAVFDAEFAATGHQSQWQGLSGSQTFPNFKRVAYWNDGWRAGIIILRAMVMVEPCFASSFIWKHPSTGLMSAGRTRPNLLYHLYNSRVYQISCWAIQIACIKVWKYHRSHKLTATGCPLVLSWTLDTAQPKD